MPPYYSDTARCIRERTPALVAMALSRKARRIIGGPSAVAPLLLSGLAALLNQKLGTPVGYLNPLLYTSLAKTGAFHDITKGNNPMLGGYKAGPGWNAASGLGSPDGSAMLAALTGSKKEAAVPPAGAASVAVAVPREDESARKQKRKLKR